VADESFYLRIHQQFVPADAELESINLAVSPLVKIEEPKPAVVVSTPEAAPPIAPPPGYQGPAKPAPEAITVGGSETETYGKNHTQTVGGNQSVTVAKDGKYKIGKNRATEVGEDDSVNVGKKFAIVAGESIMLKTGDAILTMKKDGTITIKGKDITIEGSGGVGVTASKDMTLKGKNILQN